MRRELLPNATGVLLVEFALRAGYAPVLIGSLGFLGFGLRPPTPEWGLMISENRALLIVSPVTVLGPGLALASLVVGLNLFTEGLARILGRTVKLGRAMIAEPLAVVQPVGRLPPRTDGWLRVVDDVTFAIAQGEVFGLVGESGCGKSTVALQLLGYRHPAMRDRRGRRCCSRATTSSARCAANSTELRGNRISFVPQNPTTALNPGIRVGSQIAEVLAAHPRQCASTTRRSALHELLSTWSACRGTAISGAAIRTSFRAASSSASASPWRSPAIPISSFLTSRPPASTSPRRSRSSSLLIDLRSPARHVDALCDA